VSDFERNVWCLLGLPFDAIDMQTATGLVRASAFNRSPCFISTPNLNFLITSQSDKFFRASVINSEISVADGMPLVWMARLLGIPLPGRVAGSEMIEIFRKPVADNVRPLSVYFFGGEEGIAEQACQVITHEQGGLSCAGFYSPGFGSIEEMSRSDIIEAINATGADFVIVSLGAKKGQQWIEHNREHLSAPVIAHLGAVVNFVAGNVQRAPVWMQKTGSEWMWRILQEPELWRRYFGDGTKFLWLLLRYIVPYAVWRVTKKRELRVNHPVTYEINHSDDMGVISLHGNCVNQSIDPLRTIFRLESAGSQSITLDLSDVPMIDGAFLGLCMMLNKHLGQNGFSLQFTNMNASVRKIFRWNCAEHLL
jgi:N-acetylglucosaminyldiphosphoundecaprenol N-acetyl-beta-D-mannosaminyltransferase